jgi:hypothetical protein
MRAVAAVASNNAEHRKSITTKKRESGQIRKCCIAKLFKRQQTDDMF